MKKTYNLFMVSVLMLGFAGFVFAAPAGNGQALQNSVETANMKIISEPQVQERARVKNGSYLTASGLRMQVQEITNNRFELGIGGTKVETSLEITSDSTSGEVVLSTELSNGRNVQMKIMPDVASEKALERLQLKNCVAEDGCSIELKEVGAGDGAKLVYQVKTQKASRIFGLFRARMNVEAQVDAETGEIIRTRKPWWAFLAREAEDDSVASDEAEVAIDIEEAEVEAQVMSAENFQSYEHLFEDEMNITEIGKTLGICANKVKDGLLFLMGCGIVDKHLSNDSKNTNTVYSLSPQYKWMKDEMQERLG